MNAIQKADLLAARLLMMCFLMPVRIQVLVAIGTCVYFVGRTIVTKEWAPKSDYWWALLLGSGYLLYVFAVPLTPAPFRGFVLTLCERKAAYFLLPFVFAITAQRYRELIAGQAMYFVYACIAVCIAGNADFAYHHFIKDGGGALLSHVRYRVIFETFTGVHPTYMSVYLAFAVCITMLYTTAVTVREQLLKYAIVYTLLLFMLALFAKSPLIALALIAVHYMYSQRAILHKYRGVFLSFMAIITGAYFFIPFFRQRAAEMLGLFGGTTEENILHNSVSTRRLLWDTDVSMVKHYWLAGVGPGRVLDLLHQRYFFHSLYRGYPVGYFDPHNQFFSEWLSFGIIGILLLLVVLFVQFRRAIKSANVLYLYLLIILSVTFFTETLLARQHGVLFYAVFTSLFFFNRISYEKANAE